MSNTAFYATFLPYLLAASLLLALAALRAWRLYDRNVDWSLALLLSLCAALVAGFNDLGTDASAYRQYYSELGVTTDHFFWWEPGFELLAMLFAGLGAPYGVFVFACVLASHLIKLYVFDRIAPNRLLAFFVLFCLSYGEVAFVRQYIAASLILLSFLFLTRTQNALGLLSMLVAASFHKSAVVAGAVLLLHFHFRWSLLKPIVLCTLVAIAVIAILPANVLERVEARVYAQIAAYTLEGFVQGLQAANVSLFRNVAKFALYVALAAWMVIPAVKESSESVQRKSALIVISLSAVSAAVILTISPAFARLSTYIFPFLALCMRAERFRPTHRELAGQYTIATLLLVNLAIAIYPYVEFL